MEHWELGFDDENDNVQDVEFLAEYTDVGPGWRQVERLREEAWLKAQLADYDDYQFTA